jgi:hypothetical protein
MSPDAAPAPESGGVQGFIRERQVGVLQRAITTLSSCPDEDLIAESHRLSGTLGTYQLAGPSKAVRDLYDLARVGDVPPSDIDRGGTIAALVATLDEFAAATGGTSAP